MGCYDTREVTIGGLDITYEYEITGQSGSDTITRVKAGWDGRPCEMEVVEAEYTLNDIEIHDIYIFGEDMPDSFRFFVPRADTFDKNKLPLIDLIKKDCSDYLNEV